jgi:hypothetical protein
MAFPTISSVTITPIFSAPLIAFTSGLATTLHRLNLNVNTFYLFFLVIYSAKTKRGYKMRRYTTTLMPARAAERINDKLEDVKDINVGATIKKREAWDGIAMLVENTKPKHLLKLINAARQMSNEGKL